MEYDDKYWRNYTSFIKGVEDLTTYSPANLIQRYSELVEELEDINEDYYLEWKYELGNDVFVRDSIEKVFKSHSLLGNVLLESFRSQIKELDKRIKDYVINYNQDNWWKQPSIKFPNK